MRFFVPSANDPHHAEEIYKKIRNQVAESTGPISQRRIYRLKFRHGDAQHTAMVGSDRHCFGNGHVVAIFEGSNGMHYVCTQGAGGSEGEPHAVKGDDVVQAEEFSALA